MNSLIYFENKKYVKNQFYYMFFGLIFIAIFFKASISMMFKSIYYFNLSNSDFLGYIEYLQTNEFGEVLTYQLMAVSEILAYELYGFLGFFFLLIYSCFWVANLFDNIIKNIRIRKL